MEYQAELRSKMTGVKQGGSQLSELCDWMITKGLGVADILGKVNKHIGSAESIPSSQFLIAIKKAGYAPKDERKLLESLAVKNDREKKDPLVNLKTLRDEHTKI